MVDSAPSGPAYREHPVWLALERYSVGPDNAALSFAARLARENGWTAAFAERVLREYKRFAFLAATAGHSVTPSDAVDQAWHLHLTYSRDYWERFCPQVLGRPLHHDPTAGGATETQRFFEQYAATLRSYAETFGEDAPEDIWPSAAQRLLDDPRARRVHPREGMVIRRERLGLIVTVFAGAAAIVTWAMTQGS
jgi:hypothetical protein